jgi:type II secretory pathway predicted ATPase ExeA
LLSREETRSYVLHRSTLAGAPTDPFDAEAHEAIFELSRGNLRAIDHLALKSLQLAAAAGLTAVSAAELIAARNHLWP